MKKWVTRSISLSLLTLALASLTACGTDDRSTPANGEQKQEVTLILGSYSVPKEAFQAILPKFQQAWQAKTGQQVNFQESYEASGAQARAIAGGFQADIAALSLEADIDTIAEAGLITHDWRKKTNGGMITSSVVAIGTREGNPKGIKDWSDLVKPDTVVLYPNPKSSGGAQWDINAIYGAGLKLSEEKGAKDPAAAASLLAAIHKNVKVMDKSGRASMTTFESGVGDAVVTYENELLARVQEGGKYSIIVPNYTIRIDNPVAVVDKNADKHGVREVAEAFVDYLWSAEAQNIFAEKGFRSVDQAVAAKHADKYQTPAGQFDIDYLGGWEQVRKELYAKGALWDQIVMEK